MTPAKRPCHSGIGLAAGAATELPYGWANSRHHGNDHRNQRTDDWNKGTDNRNKGTLMIGIESGQTYGWANSPRHGSNPVYRIRSTRIIPSYLHSARQLQPLATQYGLVMHNATSCNEAHRSDDWLPFCASRSSPISAVEQLRPPHIHTPAVRGSVGCAWPSRPHKGPTNA